MPLYSYTGKNVQGDQVHGSIETTDIQSAHAELQQQGILAEEVFQVSFDSPSPQEMKEEEVLPAEPSVSKQISKTYFPITDTLRLYAGWLLAWYGLIYALGSYQSSRSLSFEIPYLMGIYHSPLVLSFTLGSFLFLLFSSLHRTFGRTLSAGIFFTAIGIALFIFYRMNV